MIPLRLRLSGFLSYRDSAELDFTGFDLACISGPNGAGKSTLLDAITWALFGQARTRDDSLINLQSRAAEVVFTFQYENAEYRVQRSLVRGKTPILEFQVRQAVPLNATQMATTDLPPADPPEWRPLTERTVRETQTRIEQILRLDYDTFVNASFFLQGRADQFTQQSPAKRKEVLSSILGLESWDTYKARSAEERRLLEAELASVDGHLGEIEAELGEELPRRRRLEELESGLAQLAAARQSQAATLENVRKTHASLDKQRELIDTQQTALGNSRQQLSTLETRLVDRQAVRLAHANIAGRASEIETAYQAWQRGVQQLEQWDRLAASFRDREKERLPIQEGISAEKARLEEELRTLLTRKELAEEHKTISAGVEAELQTERKLLSEADARLAKRNRLQAEYAAARETIAASKAENDTLKVEMDSLKTRIETLQSASGAVCPLCGQPLSKQHRKSTLRALAADGKQRGDLFRANKEAATRMAAAAARLEKDLVALSAAENEKLARSATVAQLNERLEALRILEREWGSTGLRRLDELSRILERGKYAVELRRRLAQVDRQLLALGYDAAAHDAARRAEGDQRSANEEYRLLESARAALEPLENEVQTLEAEIARRRAEIARQETDLAQAASALDTASQGLPDLAEAERLLFELQGQENILNQQVGAARQRVLVLEDLRVRSGELKMAREALAVNIGRHKVLERAFGRDGVPALLIEQALPEIESRANEVLDRLSNGQMSVRFMTQTGYKDRKREDLKETLEIQISDGAGARDYEMYSGGEAFRVNFAIRLALSEVLAGRKGARLQTLVIDEGFGSQDNQGRQRLIEAINLVRADFAKILLITHLDELKDAFPTRIEVEKTDRGSVLSVM